MNQKIFIPIVLGAIGLSHNAWALDTIIMCFIESTGGSTTECSDVNRVINCGTATYTDCNTCASGYTRSTETITISSTESYTIGTCTRTLSPIEPITPTCPDLCPENTWTDYGNTQQIRCNDELIIPACEYQCRAGYYGDGTTCTRCPSSGGVYGTSAAGSTAITSCYIPANSSMSDTTGTYTFTSNCYYSN
ncbi:MAG: hypothetical protein IJX89_00490 [Alphaproteobacteria bacterium]|nr:hypothetical protein [Alphaproteobacteria bacterium]